MSAEKSKWREIGFMQLRKNNGNQRSIRLSYVIYGNHIIYYYILQMTRLDPLNVQGFLILYLFHSKLFTFYIFYIIFLFL